MKKFLKIYIVTIFTIIFSIFCIKNIDSKQSIILINPAGHAKQIGRKLSENYERGITFKFALELQKKIQEKYGFYVILTRSAGEEVVAFQNASFANRLDVNFFLSLHIYKEESVKPKLFLYYLTYNPLVDTLSKKFDPFYFIPIHQAHFMNISKTISFGNNMKKILTAEENQKRFDFYGNFGIPFKNLCGIISPAVAIEAGLSQDSQLNQLIDPIVDSLYFLTI